MADTDINLSVDLDVKDAQQTAKDLQKEVEKVFESHQDEQSASLTNLEITMKKTYDQAEELRNKLTELGQDVPTPEYSSLLSSIAEAEDRFDALGDKIATSTSVEYESQLQQLEAVDRLLSHAGSSGIYDATGIIGEAGKYWSVDELRAYKQELETTVGVVSEMTKEQNKLQAELDKAYERKKSLEDSGDAIIIGKETTAYQKAQEQLDLVNDKLKQQLIHHKEIEQAQDIASQKVLEKEQKAEQVAEQRLLKEQQISAQKEIQASNHELSETTHYISSLTMSIRGIGRLIPGVSTSAISAISGVTRGVIRLSKTTGGDMVSAVNVLKSAVLSLFKTLAAHPILLIIAAIAALVTKLVGMVQDYQKEREEAYNQLVEKIKEGLDILRDKTIDFVKASIKWFVKLGTALPRTVWSLIQTISNKIKSLESDIQENLDLMAQWRDGFNEVNKALSGITSSIDYLKASIATSFAPILVQLEPIITSVSDRLVEVINLIGMFIAKISGATSYTKAIKQQKDYADSLDKTSKSASSASKSLASFDKLNILNGASGSAASQLSEGFETIELKDTPFPDWMKDFRKLGKDVGNKLKRFLMGIPWDSFLEKSKQLGSNVALFLNGFNSTEDLGLTIGDNLAQGINTITTGLTSFIDDFKGTLLGMQLQDSLIAMIKKVDWKKVGDLFSGSLNTISDVLTGFFTDLSTEDLGIAISDFLSGALGDIDWDKIELSVRVMGHKLAEFLNSVVTPENFSLIVTSISNGADMVFSALDAFTQSAEWDEWGKSIGDGINKLFDPETWEFRATAISNFALGVLDMLLAAVTEIDWDALTDSIVEFVSNIDWAKIGDRAHEISMKLIAGLDKVWEALKQSGALEAIFDLIVQVLNDMQIWKNWFAKIKDEVGKEVVGSTLGNIFKIAINDSLLKKAQNAINKVLLLINEVIKGLNDTFGLNLGLFRPVNIQFDVPERLVPGLAQGAVLPPNRPFLAMVGDQKNGTNIEAPLSTIKEALIEAMGEQAFTVNINLEADSNNIFKSVRKSVQVYRNQTGGKSPF